MSKRPYRLGRRAETASETRQRIVEATYALHAEQGIAATTMKQIAERANVSPGSVYHHFPSYADVIQACGKLTMEIAPPPDEAIFEGAPPGLERIRRLVRAVFRYYESIPVYEYVRCEQRQFPELRAYVMREQANRSRLARLALGGRDSDPVTIATIVALLDLSVWRSLRAEGMSTDEGATQIAAVINAWHAGGDGAPAAPPPTP